jgi:hypothetical protein
MEKAKAKIESLDQEANHIIEEAPMVLPGNPGALRYSAHRGCSIHVLRPLLFRSTNICT